MKNKTLSLSKKYEQYILDCIDSSGHNVDTKTDHEKVIFLWETFNKEYVYPENIRRYGSLLGCFIEWLPGLPSCLNIEFENHKILQLAQKMGSLAPNATEKQKDRILENYWIFMAKKAFSLFRKHGIGV